MKAVLWAAIALIVAMWLLRGKKSLPGADAAPSAQPGNRRQDAEAMVRCAHCGIHIPASESVADSSGALFCGDEHRLRHSRS